MAPTKINLLGIQELDITGIIGSSVSNGVVSFTVPPASVPVGVTGAIQYNNSGVFGGSAATADGIGDITLPAASSTFTGTFPTLIASGTARAHASSGQVTLNTTGATLLVAVIVDFNNVATISDSAGNTWNYLATQGTVGKTRIAYAFGITTNAADVFTVTGAGTFAAAAIFAFSGTLTTAAVFDAQGGLGNDNLASPFNTGNFTPAAGDIVVYGIGANGGIWSTVNINDGFSTPIFQGNGADEVVAGSYIINTSSVVLNPTWTLTGGAVANSNAVWATFKTGNTTVNKSSPQLSLQANYISGGVPTTDTWNLSDVVDADGSNSYSFLTLAHSGVASGFAYLRLKNSIVPDVDNAYDFGSGSTFGSTTKTTISPLGNLRFRNIFVGNQLIFPDGSIATPSISFSQTAGNVNLGLSCISTALAITQNGFLSHWFNATQYGDVRIINTGGFTWSSSASNAMSSADTGLFRLGAASLAIGTGAAGDFSGSLKLGQLTSTNTTILGGTTGGVALDGSLTTNASFYVRNHTAVWSGGVFGWSTNNDPTSALNLGLSKLGAASLAIGNGTAGDVTGTLTLSTVLYGNGAVGTPSIAQSSHTSTGLYFDSTGNYIVGTILGTASLSISNATGLNLAAGNFFGWSSTTDPTATADTTIARNGAGGIRVGVNGNATGTITCTVFLVGSGDTGLSRFGAASVALGNGNVGDFTGSLKLGALTATVAAPTVAAAQIGYGSTTAATASAGGGAAPPATVDGYVVINVAGTNKKIPYYAV